MSNPPNTSALRVRVVQLDVATHAWQRILKRRYVWLWVARRLDPKGQGLPGTDLHRAYTKMMRAKDALEADFSTVRLELLDYEWKMTTNGMPPEQLDDLLGIMPEVRITDERERRDD